MKVVIVFAHPSHKSYNYALLEALLSGLKEGGHEAKVIDLYKDNFDPVLRETIHNPRPGELCLKYQAMIKDADWMAFIFPVFWYRAPAIMEGFFDHVFASKFAFKYKKILGGLVNIPIGLLPVKKAIVIETYGGPGWFYKLFFFRIPWIRIKSVLKFCGIRKFIHHPCYSVLDAKRKVLKKYLSRVKNIGKNLK